MKNHVDTKEKKLSIRSAIVVPFVFLLNKKGLLSR